MILYINGQDISRLVLALEKSGETFWGEYSVGPEEYLKSLNTFLDGHSVDLEDIEQIVTVVGPGSSTALRASLSIVNTVGFALQRPVVPLEKAPETDDKTVFESFLKEEGAEPVDIARPVYAHGPRISKSKKDALGRKKA